jgi:hypothetical protein
MRPVVLLISLLILVPLAFQLVVWFRARHRARAPAGSVLEAAAGAPTVPASQETVSVTVSLALAALLTLVFGYALILAVNFLPDARLLPLLAIIPGVALAATALVQEVRPFWRGVALPALGEEVVGELVQFGFLVLLIVGIWTVGFVPAVALYLFGILLRKARMHVVTAAVYCALLVGFAYWLASLMLMHLPPGMLF